ncbi:CPn0927/CPn0928 family alpha/beta hydrolase fold protein [Chlamydia vaughanii]|uniref:CPn0927/CPn0928 family alpha/beta hydrolase fold protein n=1 Tax=Chlamydia vaughanii TaxID=3112552 RepID=UPI0039F54D8C
MFLVNQTSIRRNTLEEMNPVPEVYIFSSESAHRVQTFRENYPRLYKTVNIIWKIVKIIFKIIFFIPFGLFWVLGRICQNVVLPAAGGPFSKPLCSPKQMVQEVFATSARALVDSGYAESVRRIPIQSDDLFIDALSITFPEAKPGRWMLYTLGNSECFEHRTLVFGQKNWILDTAKNAQANVLVMNYPGVMHSKGPVTRESLKQAYRSCVKYLRDCPDGPKAKQMIAYGYSIGTAVQAMSLDEEITDGSDGVNWFVVKDRAPRAISAIAGQWLGKFGVYAAKLLNWEVDVAALSAKLTCPELFIHGCDESSVLIGDGLFKRENCCVAPFLKPGAQFPGEKISVSKYLLTHQGPLEDESVVKVANHIKAHFDSENLQQISGSQESNERLDESEDSDS